MVILLEFNPFTGQAFHKLERAAYGNREETERLCTTRTSNWLVGFSDGDGVANIHFLFGLEGRRVAVREGVNLQGGDIRAACAERKIIDGQLAADGGLFDVQRGASRGGIITRADGGGSSDEFAA